MGTLRKLLALIAVLLLPLGMQPAAAAPTVHHAASMPMSHCPDQGSKAGTKGAFAECTMACSAALPAADLVGHQPLLIVREPPRPVAVEPLHGRHPDTATPPPRRS